MAHANPTKLAALLIGLVGVGGFVALLIAADHHPHEAAFLRIMALVWLLSCGATKLIFTLTETAGRGDQAARPTPRP